MTMSMKIFTTAPVAFLHERFNLKVLFMEASHGLKESPQSPEESSYTPAQQFSPLYPSVKQDSAVCCLIVSELNSAPGQIAVPPKPCKCKIFCDHEF